MKKIITLSLLAGFTVLSGSIPVLAQQSTGHIKYYSICTRESGSRVNLRTSPGTHYSIGLEQVGSGGRAVDDSFRELGYSLSSDDLHAQEFDRYRVVQNAKGESWSLIGTNQWTAWVRSDFVCPSQ